MSRFGMRAATAIVGAASTGCGRNVPQTPIAMASRVVAEALEDAGLQRRQLDGLIVHIGSPRGTDYDLAASMLGLNVRFAAEPWSHGRFAATVVAHAAMALMAGLADYVVCLAAYKNSLHGGKHGTKSFSGFRESLRAGGGPHGEVPHAGFTAPGQGAALAARAYFQKYGVSWDKLATVALTEREHANLNPQAAMYQKKLTPEDYASARFIFEPLRLFDFSIPADGATAFILTTKDRAEDCRRPPIPILGFQGISAGPQEYIFGQPALGFNQSDVFDYTSPGENQEVYRMASLKPADVDTLHCYDAFAPNVLYTLERMGHCPVGEAANWIQGGRISLGGDLPVNTSGGMLSEGHLNGWPQMMEIVRQLRGEAGPRQIQDVKVGQWATPLGDSVLFGHSSLK